MGNDIFSAIHAQQSQAPPLAAGDVFSQIHAAANAPAQPETGVWAGVKRNTVGMVAGLYHAFVDSPTDAEKAQLMQKVQAEKDWQTAHGYDPNQVDESLATDPSRVTLAYHRLVDAPAGALAQKGTSEQAAAKDLLSKGQTWKGSNLYVSGATDRLLSAVPMAGPWLNSVAQRAESGDVSGAATDVASAVAYSKAPEIMRATGVPKALSNFLKSSAEKNYQDVLNPTRVDTKYQTAKIMPQLMEEAPIAITRKGLAAKAAGQADIAGQQIEDVVSNLQGSMKTQPVIDGLENLRQKYQVNGKSLRPEVDSSINALQDQLREISKPGDAPRGAQGPGEATISYQDVVKARRILDDAVAEVGGYQGRALSDTSLANVRKATANSFREELGNASPDLAAVNAKFHFWNTLSDVLDATNQRKVGQVGALSKVETVVAGAGGLAHGGLSGAAGYAGAMSLLGKVIRSTAWRTVSAATKSGIADALTSGDFGTVKSLLLGGQALSQANQASSTANGYKELGNGYGGMVVEGIPRKE